MADSQKNNDPPTDVIDAEIVDAEILPAVLADGQDPHSAEVSPTDHPDPLFHRESLFDTNVRRLSAKGGAVGGVLLAVLGLVGMPFSSYSFFNVVMAIVFSIWGLKSPLRKTATAGLLIALAGVVAFLVNLEN